MRFRVRYDLVTMGATVAMATTMAASVGFAQSTVRVTSEADDGPGSFRAAVEAANADSTVRRIVFKRDLEIEVDSDVTYTGAQSLTLVGRGSSVTASDAAVPAPTWDGGLFASTGGADLRIQKLGFYDSPNNGIGVFVPADAEGSIKLILSNVTVDGARFHGVFFDGQTTTGFNTDDVLHPDCVDPYPADPAASMEIAVWGSTITNNGTLAGGFDTGTPFELDGETVLTGCPADFDGIRVDDGGDGGIHGSVVFSTVDGNLADGIEFDDTGAGGVSLFAAGTQIHGNGETGTDDLDDGLDIDEADEGSLEAVLVGLSLRDNRDEGLDLDEAGEGDVLVIVRNTDSSANEDEGFKIDEEDAGNLFVQVSRSTFDDSLSQDGVDLTEEGDGNFFGVFLQTGVQGNDGDAIDADQEDAGEGALIVIGSDLTGNANVPSLDLGGIVPTLIGTAVDE